MKTLMFTLIFSFFALPLFAQNPDRALREHLVSPKHVLKAQKKLKLTDKQKFALKEAIKKAQSSTLDLQFELQAETEKLVDIVKQNKVDMKKAEAQAKKIMALETKVKLTQLKLSIETKNLLTAKQRVQVQKFAEQMREKRQERRKEKRDGR